MKPGGTKVMLDTPLTILSPSFFFSIGFLYAVRFRLIRSLGWKRVQRCRLSSRTLRLTVDLNTIESGKYAAFPRCTI